MSLLLASHVISNRWKLMALEHQEIYKKIAEQMKPDTIRTQPPYTASSQPSGALGRQLNHKAMTNELAIRVLVDEFRTCQAELKAFKASRTDFSRQLQVVQE